MTSSNAALPKGLFVAFEGIDGAGTTTQVQKCAERLRARGVAVHTTREPSDRGIGKLIRGILTGGEHVEAAVALLFAADRLDHYHFEIAPALAEGQVVLTDRYLLSSLVYQGELVGDAFVTAINQQAPAADLTVLIDIDAGTALARRTSRGDAEERYDAHALQARLAARYRREAEARAYAVVDGSQTPDALAEHITALIIAAAGRQSP